MTDRIQITYSKEVLIDDNSFHAKIGSVSFEVANFEQASVNIGESIELLAKKWKK